jgi:hypothetical protein
MLRPYIYKYPSFVKKLNKFQKDFFVSYGIHIFVETTINMKDLNKLSKEELGILINKLEGDMKKFIDIKDMKKINNTNKTL